MIAQAVFFIALFFLTTETRAHDFYDPCILFTRAGLENKASGFHHAISIRPIDTHARNYDNNRPRSTLQWEQFFAAHGMSEEAILSNARMYLDVHYLAAAKKLPSYAKHLKKHAQRYARYSVLQKTMGLCNGSYTPGLAKQLVALQKECEREEKKRIQQRQKLAAKQQAAAQHEQAMRQRMAYQNQLLSTKHRLASHGAHPGPRQKDRFRAIEQTIQENQQRTARHCECNEQVYSFAKHYDILESAIKDCAMDAYQYQIHTEFLDQLTEVTALQNSYQAIDEASIFLDVIGHSVAQGICANQNKQPEAATYWADAAWQALDIAKAIGEGVYLGARNTANFVISIGSAIIHPVNTGTTVAHGIANIVELIARATATAARFDSALEHDHEEYATLVHNAVNQIDTMIHQYAKHLEAMPARDKVKYTSALITEAVIPAKALKAGQLMCSRMRPLLVECLEVANATRKEQVIVEVAGVGENVMLHAEAIIAGAEIKIPAGAVEASIANEGSGIIAQLKPLGLGSTGRTEAISLTEKLVMEEIVSNPSLGQVLDIRKGMTDARWFKGDGWKKMTWYKYDVEIHYVAQWKNGTITAIDDFKFINKII